MRIPDREDRSQDRGRGTFPYSDETQLTNLLASIVESSQDAIISKTLDGTIRTWNKSAERLFGYASDEAVGQHISLIIPEDRLPEETLIISRLRNGERIEHFETERCTKDGKPVYLSITVSPIHDNAGRIIGASKVARDISDRLRTEEMLKEEARRKDEFLAVLAHELRNPLAPLRNVIELLSLKEKKSEEEEWGLSIMDRQVSQLARLIDDLLDVARISSNKLELRKEALDMRDAVALAMETSQPHILQAGHELKTAIPDEPVPVQGDLVRLAQVISNLLNNASKYSTGGGTIRLSLERDRSEAVLTVADTGIGIAPEMLPHIFDMFSQVEAQGKTPKSGLGIGLALVKNLVELHGGSVSVASEEGSGSTFMVRLPLRRGKLPAAKYEPEDDVSLKGLRVLIVDDNADATESLEQLLKSQGCTVKTGHDGFDAYQIASAWKPHALLLDIGMPKMNGLEVAQMIRRQPWGADIVLIATTGWGQESDRHNSKVAGFDHHFVKPIDFNALRTLLATIDRTGKR